MPTSPNLNIAHIEESQLDKEVTANEAFDALDDAMNSQLSIANADANFSLTVAQLTRHRSFRLTGTTTASRTMTIPAIEREFTVRNLTGNDIVVSTGVSPGGETVTVANQEEAVLACNATDVRKVTDRIEHLSGHIETPEANTLSLIQSLPYKAKVLSLTHQMGDGDLSATLNIDGVAVTGITLVAVTTTESTPAATGNNEIPSGGKLTLVLSNIGSPAPSDYQFTVKLVRL